MSISELKTKEVINVCDGKRYGNVIDLEFSQMTGQVQALVVPGGFDLFALVRGQRKGLIIPWEQICCIGEDSILVEFREPTT